MNKKGLYITSYSKFFLGILIIAFGAFLALESFGITSFLPMDLPAEIIGYPFWYFSGGIAGIGLLTIVISLFV